MYNLGSGATGNIMEYVCPYYCFSLFPIKSASFYLLLPPYLIRLTLSKTWIKSAVNGTKLIPIGKDRVGAEFHMDEALLCGSPMALSCSVVSSMSKKFEHRMLFSSLSASRQMVCFPGVRRLNLLAYTSDFYLDFVKCR